jgi:16S rRNA (guanine527-N7)-methyltransferase
MRAAPQSALASDRERALAITPVSREAQARLDRFVDLLLAEQSHTNLISNSSVATLWTRHIADSLQLLDLAPDAKVWIDLGTGAGFPGLVLACGLADRPRSQVHLVESALKKANFLQRAADHIGAPVMVHAARIEDFANTVALKPDVVTARALAPLNKLLGLARPLLEKGAQGLFPKGQDVAHELTEASKYWNFEPTLVPSKTQPSSRIVCVRGPVRPAKPRNP